MMKALLLIAVLMVLRPVYADVELSIGETWGRKVFQECEQQMASFDEAARGPLCVKLRGMMTEKVDDFANGIGRMMTDKDNHELRDFSLQKPYVEHGERFVTSVMQDIIQRHLTHEDDEALEDLAQKKLSEWMMETAVKMNNKGGERAKKRRRGKAGRRKKGAALEDLDIAGMFEMMGHSAGNPRRPSPHPKAQERRTRHKKMKQRKRHHRHNKDEL